MPPVPMPRPDAATYDRVATYLETELDRAAAAKPNPGDLPNLHRLTRTEYRNAIRDLLALDNLPKEMDYTLLLPADNASSGFDNIADLLYVSPATMERYLDASTKISRLAVGDPAMPLMVNIYRTPLEGPQDSQVEDLAFGTRGGTAIRSYFPLDGEYEIQVELAGGARDPNQLEVTVDGERKELVTLGGGGGRGGRGGRRRGGRGGAIPTNFRIAVKAGPRLIGVTFVQKTEALDEATLHPRQRSRGTQPSIAAVTIRGPYNATGPGDTPSRQRIFTCRPANAAAEPACAKQILSTLARRAYRRPVTDADVATLLAFYDKGRKERDFDLGIQRALERLLVSPQFLYRIERDPAGAAPGSVHAVSDLELASRLSFFLWSSIPDDELLNVAAAGKLKQPEVLEQQVKRMLADPRSESMVNNFAAQWLYLRDVDVKDPDLFVFREFDEGLRQSFEKETQLFLDSVLRENRSVIELLTANYTFVNERLAKHYGIPNIRGSRIPACHLPERQSPGRAAGTGQHPAADLVFDAHLAGAAGQIRSGESAGVAASSASAQRSLAEHGWREIRRAAYAAGSHGAASGQPRVCQLPCAHGSHRIRDGELRRRGQMARSRRQQRHRRFEQTDGWNRGRRSGGREAADPQGSAEIRRRRDRQTADVRHRAQRAVFRRAGRS